MESLEELEQRKKELQLRRDIAKLEAAQRMDGNLSNLSSWWIVGPIALLGVGPSSFSVESNNHSDWW
ncbi:MAG: hypothetical protein Q8L91_17525 [Polaromonas sp.]|nr:hypothetical protein [Polaromonas sp.]MDP3086173.1 hypothetical protein [Rubrivivax sp.]